MIEFFRFLLINIKISVLKIIQPYYSCTKSFKTISQVLLLSYDKLQENTLKKKKTDSKTWSNGFSHHNFVDFAFYNNNKKWKAKFKYLTELI